MELLDRNSQPSLVANMQCMKITQRVEKKIVLELRDNSEAIANKIEITPYRLPHRFTAQFWKHHQPRYTNKDLSISELKSLLNRYTILELV